MRPPQHPRQDAIELAAARCVAALLEAVAAHPTQRGGDEGGAATQLIQQRGAGALVTWRCGRLVRLGLWDYIGVVNVNIDLVYPQILYRVYSIVCFLPYVNMFVTRWINFGVGKHSGHL